MVKSKAWNWNAVKENEEWLVPAPEMFYLSEVWKKKNYKSVMDVGSGLGRNCIYLASKGFEVSGFDLSKESVEQTLSNGKKAKVKLGKFVVADMLNFPFEDNSFDVVLAMNVISHTDLNGFKKILNEIKRTLKSGGEAYFTLGSKESFWFNDPRCKYVDEYTRIKVDDGPENGIPHFYINDDDCKELFNDFDVVQMKHVREMRLQKKNSCQYHIWLRKK